MCENNALRPVNGNVGADEVIHNGNRYNYTSSMAASGAMYCQKNGAGLSPFPSGSAGSVPLYYRGLANMGPANRAPTVANGTLSLAEDGTGSVTLTASDADAGDTHTFSIVSAPGMGSASMSGSRLNYIPPANWNGTTTLTYRATDSKGAASNTATITITVTPVNDAPSVANRVLTMNEDTVGTLAMTVTDIDLSYEGDSHTWEIVTGPDASDGGAVITGGTLTFKPVANWSGTATLTYRARDSKGVYSNTATITVTVNPVNDVPSVANRVLTMNEDTVGTLAMTVTDIDLSYEGDSHTWEIVTGPDASDGGAVITGGTLTFKPVANWSGTATLTYRARDSKGVYSNTATITVTVNPVNDVPVADPKSLTTPEDTAATVTLSATDIDSPAPTVFAIVTAPAAASGTASITGNTLTFTPAANWNGTATLTYRAQDSSGAWSAPVSVTLNVAPVNDAPSVANRVLTMNEDTVGTLAMTVTDIDLSYEGDSHTWEIVTGPDASDGGAVITGGTLTFKPVANWSGTATLTYRARDSKGVYSNTATITVTVNPVNDVPVADPKSLTTPEDTAATVTLSATDIDSPAPTVFAIVTAPAAASGTASITGNTLTFTPAANWNGTATLTYRAQDSSGAWSAPVSVTLNVAPVNDAPSVANRVLTMNEDTVGTLAMTVTDIDLSYEGDSHTWEIVTGPDASDGGAVITGGTLTFKPVANWSGTATLTYRARDSKGVYSNTATITVTVNPVNDVPSVANRVLTMNEDTVGTLAMTVTDIDLSYEGDSHTWEIVTGPDASDGGAVITGGTLTFKPVANWSGTATLTYRARDSKGVYSNTATITVTVNPVNDVPVADPKSLTTPEDTAATVTLSATDIDSPAPTVFAIVTAPAAASGTASITGNTLTFTPAANWNGTATLTYRAQDSSGAWSAPVSVTLNVAPVNDAPSVANRVLTMNEDTVGTLAMTVTDIDLSYEGDSHTWEIVTGPDASDGGAVITGGTLTFKPVANWSGTATLTYRARDSKGVYSNTATITVTVNPVNDVPSVANRVLTMNEDTVGTLAMTVTDIDLSYEGDSHTWEIVTGPDASDGGAVITGGTLTFKPVANWSGTATLTYRARDSKGVYSNTATITVTVNPVNDVPVADPKSLTTPEDTAATVTLSATDIDSPAPTVFAIVTAPAAASGTASITGNTLTFTPAANWNGTATLTYRAQDSSGAWSAPVSVTLNVAPVNDVPALKNPITITTHENKPATIETQIPR
ncbi:tandem-95 repeat protein [Aquipseudomonas alcaligenes]|uniref:tandem-95 repeat protein n=1 Tax=Aquipseudomonas alcaligenes TaxID=43263 RepID=UPI001F22F0FD|nr:Ig-like domain-containing protein [Pseudomonas alcaligenes]